MLRYVRQGYGLNALGAIALEQDGTVLVQDDGACLLFGENGRRAGDVVGVGPQGIGADNGSGND